MFDAERTELEKIYVTILHGEQSRGFIKEHLEAYLYDVFKQVSDLAKLEEIRDSYIDAFEWLLANLYRTAGIQLYDDGEIRINISPCDIKDNKKCILLSESDISNRNLDSVLYDELQRLMYCGI